MRYIVIYHILLWFSFHFRVECVLEKWREKISSMLTPSPDANYPSLVLAVDKSKNCFIANVPIISHRMGPNADKYLFACPAESQDEKTKNNQESKTKNALFIREAYENPINKEKSKKNQPPDVSEDNKENAQFMEYGCVDPVIPSVKTLGAVDDNGLKIEFHLVGFEVYMGKYESLKSSDFGKKNLGLNKGFAWFNLLIIRFDRKGGNVLSVTCEMYNDRLSVRPPTTEPVQKLSDNLFMDHFYGGKQYQITNTYEEAHQQDALEALFGKTPLLKEFFNTMQQKYLSKVHLVPPDSFVHPLLEQSTRTYGNIAPMWELIRINSWSTVEKYVRHFVQAVYGVFVVTGTYGILSLTSAKYDIYLEPDKNVKVPLAFWKIVTYTKKAQQFYNILIVTENNPFDKATDLLCEKSQCIETGWGYIENDDTISTGRTYCCIITTEILKKLQLEVSDSVKVDQVLNLEKVPHWEKDKLTLDVARFIRDQKKAIEMEEPIDPTIRADNVKYRNENILLDSELKSKNNEDEGISLTGIVTAIYNYIAPVVSDYFPSSFFSSSNVDVHKKSEENKVKEISVLFFPSEIYLG